ncbi:MAG: DsbC family protein [Fluviibacter sp.]
MKKSLLWLTFFLGIHANAFASDNSLSDIPYFNWKALRLADAVKEIRGDGSRVLAVFTEPECGYCRKYEKSLEKVDNVTIYRFLMPLDPKNMARSIAIWCSGTTNQDRLKNLHVAMHDRSVVLPRDDCVNPIAENMKFAKKYDIYLTPTTIGSDGRLVQGYLPLVNLEKWLSGRGAFDK